MKNRLLTITLIISLLILSNLQVFSCTNFIITKGASKDGSTMVTYSADSHTLYGELYYRPAGTYPIGTMMDVIEWDSGKKDGTNPKPQKPIRLLEI
jgi:dipeptidase